ncbi:MAG TPA: ACT domain-containing protein, partial [Acidimicrobiales bacterium]|nr:ACT domain-containing protein [Acidimicrobiales bacterium]
AGLRSALAGPASDLNLVVTVEAVPTADLAPEGAASAPDTWTVSVHGADHPGIVHGVADLLAGADVNIIDLTTRVVGDEVHPVYVMILEVSVPANLAADELRGRLDEVARTLGVSANLHPSEADIL